MAYPKKPKGEDTNAEARPGAQPVSGAAPLPDAGMTGPQGGAPTLTTDPGVLQMRQFFAGRGVRRQPGGITPAPMSLQDAQRQWGDFSKALKEQIQKKMQNMSDEDKARPFYQNFQQYPEWAATNVVRRAWTNRLQAQGEVAEWMDWLGEMGFGRRR